MSAGDGDGPNDHIGREDGCRAIVHGRLPSRIEGVVDDKYGVALS
jgi:hypothetical protein